QPEMAGHQSLRRVHVAVLTPALGQHELLVRGQKRKLADLFQIAREPTLRPNGQRERPAAHLPTFLRPAPKAQAAPPAESSSQVVWHSMVPSADVGIGYPAFKERDLMVPV